MMEVFAAFTAHTDHEVGRLLDHLREASDWDNTMVIYIAGDNGSSADVRPESARNGYRKNGRRNNGWNTLADRKASQGCDR